MAWSPHLAQQGFGSTSNSPPSSAHGFGNDTQSTSYHGPAMSALPYGASTVTLVHQPSSLSSTAAHSGSDHLHSLFRKRIQSLITLKQSLQSKQAWFQTIDMAPEELAAAFDSHRMRKRTLRYMLFGLSLSNILDLSQPSDLARAVVSLVNELDSLADDALVALTSGAGGPSYGAQRGPKVRNFFKSGTKTLKRSAAAQAISEFGSMESTATPASASSDHTSYLMTPNLPFQVDFFQTFYTLCDMLSEIYYKMIAFLPRDTDANSIKSPPPSSGAADNGQMFSPTSANTTEGGEKAPPISSVTQELLLKADVKIKKTIHQQIKEIDVLARQMIKHELASLDPLVTDLESAPAAGYSAILPNVGASSTSGQYTPTTSGLPSGSSLPFSLNGSSQPPTSASSTNVSFAGLASSAVPSAFRSHASRTNPPDLGPREPFEHSSSGRNHIDAAQGLPNGTTSSTDP